MAEIKITATSGGGSTSLKGAASTSDNSVFVLPNADGSAGQYLKTDGNKNLGWGTDSGGGVIQIKQLRKGDATSTAVVETDNVFTNGGELLSLAITPSATSSYIHVTGMLHLVHGSGYCGHYWLTYNHSGISETMIAGNSQTGRRRTGRAEMGSNATTDIPLAGALDILFAPNTTNEITVKIRAATSDAGYPVYLNQTTGSTSDAHDGGNPLSTLTLTEIAGSISPTITDSTIYEGT